LISSCEAVGGNFPKLRVVNMCEGVAFQVKIRKESDAMCTKGTVIQVGFEVWRWSQPLKSMMQLCRRGSEGDKRKVKGLQRKRESRPRAGGIKVGCGGHWEGTSTKINVTPPVSLHKLSLPSSCGRKKRMRGKGAATHSISVVSSLGLKKGGRKSLH